jgi:hypothetical protein
LFLSATNSLHLLTPSTWRSLSTSSFHPFLGRRLRLVPSSCWVKIFMASYPPPFSPGDLNNLFFALLSIIVSESSLFYEWTMGCRPICFDLLWIYFCFLLLKRFE